MLDWGGGIEGIGLVLGPHHGSDVRGIEAVQGRAVGGNIDDIGEGRMRRGAMIALEEIVDADLPIGLDDADAAARTVVGALHLGETRDMGLEFRQEPASLLRQGLGMGVQVVEDERPQCLDPDRREAELAFVEALHLLRTPGTAERSGQVIGPGVIGAGDHLGPAVAFQKLMSPMGADIVEAAQFAILAAADEDALVVDRGGDVAPGLGQVADVASQLPGAEEYCLALCGKDLGRRIEP